MSAHTNWQSHLIMPVTMVMTNDQISWRGFRLLRRTCGRCMSRAAIFCLPKFFRTVQVQAPAAGIVRATHRTNLVYYDWEITAERLKLLPQLTQLALMVTHHQQLAANPPRASGSTASARRSAPP